MYVISTDNFNRSPIRRNLENPAKKVPLCRFSLLGNAKLNLPINKYRSLRRYETVSFVVL